MTSGNWVAILATAAGAAVPVLVFVVGLVARGNTREHDLMRKEIEKAGHDLHETKREVFTKIDRAGDEMHRLAITQTEINGRLAALPCMKPNNGDASGCSVNQ